MRNWFFDISLRENSMKIDILTLLHKRISLLCLRYSIYKLISIKSIFDYCWFFYTTLQPKGYISKLFSKISSHFAPGIDMRRRIPDAIIHHFQSSTRTFIILIFRATFHLHIYYLYHKRACRETLYFHHVVLIKC